MIQTVKYDPKYQMPKKPVPIIGMQTSKGCILTINGNTGTLRTGLEAKMLTVFTRLFVLEPLS
ncbi:MAG: hypothetical protein PHD65_04205 [Gallionella sp.]|nr:hypothetical protein [Gallionella sp.]